MDACLSDREPGPEFKYSLSNFLAQVGCRCDI